MYSRASSPSRTTKTWLTIFCLLNACNANISSLELSSTSRISTPWFSMKTSSGESEGKSRTLAGLRVGPNSASVALDDPLYKGQPPPGPLVIIRAVQSLKDAEKLADILHVEAG